MPKNNFVRSAHLASLPTSPPYPCLPLPCRVGVVPSEGHTSNQIILSDDPFIQGYAGVASIFALVCAR